jgi:hypothetical protein
LEIPPELQTEIETAVRGSLTAVSPLQPPRVFALVFFALFACLPLAVMFLSGPASAQVMTAWQFGGVASILVGGGILLAISLSQQMTPGSRHTVRPRYLLILTVAAFLSAVALLFPWKLEGEFLGPGLGCSGNGLIFAIPSAIAFWLVVRRGAMLAPQLLGATTGLLAGLVGAMVLHFQCVMPEASHLSFWHGGEAIVCGLAGFLLGKLAGQSRSAGTRRDS